MVLVRPSIAAGVCVLQCCDAPAIERAIVVATWVVSPLPEAHVLEQVATPFHIGDHACHVDVTHKRQVVLAHKQPTAVARKSTDMRSVVSFMGKLKSSMKRSNGKTTDLFSPK